MAGLCVALPVSLACGACIGASGLSWSEALHHLWAGLTGGTIDADDVAAYTIVWELRFPRAVLAAVVGAGLASVGVAVQAMVRNALADPFVLGISSGAAVGANAVLIFGPSAHSVSGRCPRRRSSPRSRPWCWCTRSPGPRGA